MRVERYLEPTDADYDDDGDGSATATAAPDRRPRIVIVPQDCDTGWTGTWCTVLLTGAYPSNQARREQMEGRINRAICQRGVRWIERLHAGILTYMLQRHLAAQSLSQALAHVAREYAAEGGGVLHEGVLRIDCPEKTGSGGSGPGRSGAM